MKQFFSVAALLLSAVISVQAAAASAGRSIHYDEINPILRVVKTEVQSKYIYLRTQLNIHAEDLAMEDLKVWIERDDQKLQDIVVGEEGKIDLPVFSEDEAEALQLVINQPKESVGLSVSTGVRAPTEQEVAYRDLFAVLEDSNRFMSELAGGMSLFMPNMDALKFVFNQPATITIQAQEQLLTYETDDELAIILDIDDDLMEENPKLAFSHAVKVMVPED